MIRSVAIHGGVLAALLAFSWAEWTAPPKVDTGDKVLLLQGEVDKIERVAWKSEKEEVSIERKLDAAGAYLWVTHTKWEEKKTPPTPPTVPEAPEADPTGADAAEAPPTEPVEPEKVAKTQIFKAGEAADELLKELSPLLALRQLTDVPADKMSTLGLDAPKESLEIVRDGRTRVLEVGGEAYGSKDRYVRDKDSGAIYLVDNEVLKPLQFARSKLPDRQLFSIPKEKVESAVISGGMATLDVLQKNAEDKEKATWVKTASPDAPAEQLVTWMNKALQLKSSSYVAEADTPADLEPRFRLTLRGTDGSVQTLEVMQSPSTSDWYGRSEHTRGLVKLLRSTTSSLSEDVDDLTG